MWLAAAFAAVGLGYALPRNASIYEEEISAKYDMGWAQNALQQAEAGAAQATQQALNASQQAGSALTSMESQAVNMSTQVGMIGTGVLGGAAKQGKLAAFAAVLAYLGTCREYFAKLPEIREAVAPLLAASFREHLGDPSESEEACEASVKEGIDAMISEHMKERKSQERIAIKWLAIDRAHILCSDKLMRALRLFECIREDYPKQYTEALRTELLLGVLTESLLGAELFRVCGQRGAYREELPEGRLFEEGGGLELASAPSGWGVPAVLVAGAGAALAAAAAAAALRGRRLQRASRCVAAGGLEDIE